ncbi:MAG TPA: protein translocase subunit SecD [Ignavibacteria bacterium]|nr:protein translocase subunit SecD [Ignavibacteria bacterium]
MKKNLTRIILTVVFIFLSIYFIYPTYKDYQLNKELSSLTGQDSINFLEQNSVEFKKLQQERIKLGLDLKGGMYVVLDVDVVKLLDDLAKNKDQVLTDALNQLRATSDASDATIIGQLKNILAEKGQTLKSYYGETRDSETDVEGKLETEIEGAIDRAVEVVRNRVDQYGVAEPQIQKVGGNRIIVELPGVSNPEDVRNLLSGTALLEFKLVAEPENAVRVMQLINNIIAGTTDTTSTSNTTDTTSVKKDTTKTSEKNVAVKKDTTKNNKDTVKKTDTNLAANDTNLLTDTNLSGDTTEQLSEEEFKKKNPWFYLVRLNPDGGTADGFVGENDKAAVERILERPDVKAILPSDVSFAWSKEAFDAGDGTKFYMLYTLKGEAELTGKVISNAQSNIDPTSNTPVVNMQMTDEGAADWARITGANIDKRIAIVLDNVVYSAPVVRGKITGGNSQIEGMANVQEAKLLEIVLKAGALPAPLKIIEERSIGPSLGEDSIKAGITSSIAALIIVALFMMVWYRTGGFIADIALVINVLFILGIMATFKATLTLPGIAGLILTLGMAVDTNVLIYERIREELGLGKPLKTSIEIGFKKAFSAIMDSHVTSIITGVILYQFGTGPIQGFALTLLFGIVANLFTAIVITHIMIDVLVEKGMKVKFG